MGSSRGSADILDSPEVSFMGSYLPANEYRPIMRPEPALSGRFRMGLGK